MFNMNGSGQQSTHQSPDRPQQQQQIYLPPPNPYSASQDMGLDSQLGLNGKRLPDARSMAANERDFMQFNPFLAAGPAPESTQMSPPQSAPLRMSMPDTQRSPFDFGLGAMGTPDDSQSKKKKRSSPGATLEEKRTKTGRACDACVRLPRRRS